MPYCQYCGAEIDYDQEYCNQCGSQQPKLQSQQKASKGGAVGWGILSFFVPLIGLILFLVWRQERPRVSKVAGLAALIGFILNLIIMVFFQDELMKILGTP